MSPFRAVLGAIHVQVIDRPSPDAPSLTQTNNCANGLFTTTKCDWGLDLQSMRTGPDQGQIGPLLRPWIFWREQFARIFFSCPRPTPVLSGRISLQPITKLPSFLLKHFAVVLNYPPNEWILRGEAPGYWLRPVLSTRGEQLIPEDDRKEDFLCHIAFLSKSRHLSLVLAQPLVQ